jgi:hypothetical protein
MKEFPELQDSFSTRLAYHVLDPIPPLLATAIQKAHISPGRMRHRASRQSSSSRRNSNSTLHIRSSQHETERSAMQFLVLRGALRLTDLKDEGANLGIHSEQLDLYGQVHFDCITQRFHYIDLSTRAPFNTHKHSARQPALPFKTHNLAV